jgi:hypothetical protein
MELDLIYGRMTAEQRVAVTESALGKSETAGILRRV